MAANGGDASSCGQDWPVWGLPVKFGIHPGTRCLVRPRAAPAGSIFLSGDAAELDIRRWASRRKSLTSSRRHRKEVGIAKARSKYCVPETMASSDDIPADLNRAPNALPRTAAPRSVGPQIGEPRNRKWRYAEPRSLFASHCGIEDSGPVERISRPRGGVIASDFARRSWTCWFVASSRSHRPPLRSTGRFLPAERAFVARCGHGPRPWTEEYRLTISRGIFQRASHGLARRPRWGNLIQDSNVKFDPRIALTMQLRHSIAATAPSRSMLNKVWSDRSSPSPTRFDIFLDNFAERIGSRIAPGWSEKHENSV